MTTFLPRARISTIEEHHLYWARLDASCVAGLRGKARTRALRYALEPELPVTIEDVATVFASTQDGRVIACACPFAELQRLAPAADMALPASVPNWLGTNLPATAFDLLRDTTSSERVRRTRRMRAAALLAVCAAVSALLTFGMLRRASGFDHRLVDLQIAITSTQDLVLPPAGPNAQPASIRLAAELRAVSSTEMRTVESELIPATNTLREVLARWPDDARLKRLSIGKRDTRIELTLPADADPAPLLADLESVDGWTLAAPIIRPSQIETSISIGLQRKEASP